MGKRVGKRLDLRGQGALWALCVCFLTGGAAGCLFAGAADGAGAQALGAYLADYLSLAGDGAVLKSFPAVMWEQFRYLLVSVLLGVTVLGVVGLPVLFAVRGFLFTFCVGCLFRVFGGRGLLPAFCLFGLPALLWAPALFLIGTQGLSWAAGVLRRGEVRGGVGPVFWVRAALSLALVLLCGLLEYLSVPVLLRAAARVVAGSISLASG